MKRSTMTLAFALVVLAVVSASQSLVQASEIVNSSETVAESNRAEHALGAYISVLGDPVPNLLGVNAAYNVTDYMRVNVGFGHTSASMGDYSASLTTLGAGAKFMMPNWSFTPVLGANLSYAILSGDTTVSNLTQSGLVPYLTAGADWQARNGFNLGFGVNIAANGVGALPYVNLGWFF